VNRFFLYLITIRYLKFKQFAWQLWYRCRPKIKLKTKIAPGTNNPKHQWYFSVNRPKKIKKNKFEFIGFSADISQPECWNNFEYPKLWHYHIHYFHDILNYTSSLSEINWLDILIKWAKYNPPMTKNSWEPYPLSLRIVNWIIWELQNSLLPSELVNHLYNQCIALTKQIEWHIDANHLWANAKALVFAGCFFKDSEHWYQHGMNLINRELQKQFYPDGGHIELSPMYHALITNDLLELIALHRLYAKVYPSQWTMRVKRMLAWCQTVTHPDGEYGFFNDCIFNIAPTYENLTKLAASLQLHVTSPSNYASGYVKLSGSNYTLLADTAEIGCHYQPGHAHADHLCFELSYNHQRIIVNSGISTYENQPLRHWQRSTSAHNTVTIDHKNSSQIWHAFRLAKRAKIINRHYSKNLIAATHDGYSRLFRPVYHSRQWHCQDRQIAITDHIQGKSTHTIDLYCYFHPACQLKIEFNKIYVFVEKTCVATLTFPEHAEIKLNTGYWYPDFGKSLANQNIQINFSKILLPYIIHWDIDIHGG